MSRVAEVLGAIARDQVERRTFCELAVVTSVFDDGSGDNSHTVSVKLKDSGLALRNLPVAAWATGLACLPRVGDVVLVFFPRGSLVSGIVFGQVYSDERRPPKFAKDEIALVWPEAQEDRAVVRLDGTDDPKVRIAAGGDDEVAIELKKGEIKLTASGIALRLTYSGSSDGIVTVDAGGTKIELKQDGDLTIKSAGKLTLRGAEVSIEADGPVKVNGATIDLN